MRRTRLWLIATLVAVGATSYVLTRIIDARYPRDGAISGTVTDDLGAPIKEAKVWFEKHAEPEGNGDDRTSTSVERKDWARTDAEGAFAFEGLRPGTYTVGAEHGEHLDAQEQTVTVRPGRMASGLRLLLARGASIAGRVIDLDGNPVPGAEISATPQGKFAYRNATAGADGAFILRGLEPGPCNVHAYADGFFPYQRRSCAPAEGVAIKMRPLPRIRGRVIDKRTQQPVEVFGIADDDVPSDTVHHPGGRFELTTYPGEKTICVRAPGYALAVVKGVRAADGVKPDELLIELVPGVTLGFHLTSAETGEPIEGATLQLERPWVKPGFVEWNPAHDQKEPLPRLLELHSDAAGECSTDHFPPGLHEFTVTHPHFASQRIAVKVEEHETQKTVEVGLGKSLTILGRVVSKAEHSPIEGATIALQDPVTLSWVFLNEQKELPRTDASGAFVLERVTPGDYTLQVWCRRFATFKQEMRFDDGFDNELLVELSPAGRIVATVKTSDGSPAIGAHLPSALSWREAWIDAEGRRVIDDLEPGPNWVTAARDSRAMQEIVCVVVSPGEEMSIDIVLGEKALFGMVTSGGQPVADAYVDVTSRMNGFCWASRVSHGVATTDEHGRYRLEGLRPGAYAVSQGDRTVVVENKDVRLDIELDETDRSSVAGVVRMPGGRPAAGAFVSLLEEPVGDDRLDDLVRAYHSFPCWTHTDEDGEFTLGGARPSALRDEPGLQPGPYSLLVFKWGYAQRFLTIHKEPRKDIDDLEIQLERDIPVLASVSAEGGELPRKIRIAVCDEQGRLGTEVFRDVDFETRQCRIYGLGAGRFTLLAEAMGYAPIRTEVTVVTGHEPHVDLDFKKGHRLAVTVLDRDSAPIPLAEVVADPGGPVSLVASLLKRTSVEPADADGRVTYDHVADGEYTVRVLAEGYEHGAAPVRVAGGDEAVTVILEPATSDEE